MAKIGLFGGTFDPPHIGHFNIAKEAYKALSLDEVIFLPNGVPAYKIAEHKVSPKEDRYNMLEGMLMDVCAGDEKWWSISTIECDREGNSYTADTLMELTHNNPDNIYYLIIGSDSFKSLKFWYKPDIIMKLSNLAVYLRDDDTLDEMEAVKKSYIKDYDAKISFIKGDIYDISSSEIRSIISKDINGYSEIELIEKYVTKRVRDYIKANKLY